MRNVPATTQIDFQKIIGSCQHCQIWRGAPIAKKYIITNVPMDTWRNTCDGLGIDCKDAGLSANIIVLTGNCKEIIIPIIAQGINRRLRVWIERSGHFYAAYHPQGSVACTKKKIYRKAHREQCAITSA